MTDHPITPPPELVEDWIELAKPLPQRPPNPGEFATLAARWGADQELEACCEWLSVPCPSYGRELRNARRPKPPSLSPSPKWQALVALENGETASGAFLTLNEVALIRRALEQLDD
jgi:hypothetical protein